MARGANPNLTAVVDRPTQIDAGSGGCSVFSRCLTLYVTMVGIVQACTGMTTRRTVGQEVNATLNERSTENIVREHP